MLHHRLRQKIDDIVLSSGEKLALGLYWTRLPLVDPRSLVPPADWNAEEDGMLRYCCRCCCVVVVCCVLCVCVLFECLCWVL